MSIPITYRGSITREQWLVNETRVVARLMADEGLSDTKEIIEKVTAQNLFQYPTEREQKSIARACCRRLLALSEDEDVRASLIDLAAHGSLEQLAQVNLYAMMRDNRVVWDFMTCVIAPKFSLFDLSLRKSEIVTFIEGLRAQDDRVATWSDATCNKVRQVLVNCIEGAEMYSRKTEALRPPLFDFELERCVRANGDEAVLPAFGITE